MSEDLILNDSAALEYCLRLAMTARNNGRAGVGSVIVKDNKIIGEGTEGETIVASLLAHAEVIAIIRAIDKLGTKDLSSCTLYTNVEPCVYCSYFIRETRISVVKYQTPAGDIGGVKGLFKILTNDSIQAWSRVPTIENL